MKLLKERIGKGRELTVRIKPADRELLERAAKVQGQTLSAFIRDAVAYQARLVLATILPPPKGLINKID